MDGRIKTVPGVMQIPGLAENLIYVSKMDDLGVKIVFEKETCRKVRGAKVFLGGVCIGTLYKILGRIISYGCNSFVVLEIRVEEGKTHVVSREKSMLWHQILGHIREKGLQVLHGKGMVEGMSNLSLDLDFCEHCLYGKNNQVRFSSGAMRESRILQLVHNYVFVPMMIP
jgi:hypothetical protein